MSAPAKVLELIDLFHRNANAYHSPHYNEAQVRQEFINPFFKCLGWDMDNERGYAEAYKDVIHEAAIKIGGATKAPDYCFRIGGVPKFFLEAKRPAVSIKDDHAPAYQLRRYAWTGKPPLSVLTDFEEFAVYDCRIRPAHTDKAGVARILLALRRICLTLGRAGRGLRPRIDLRPYPELIDYLRFFKQRLENRATKQAWYELQQPQVAYREYMENPKIIFPDIATSCRFTIDTSGHFVANTVYFLPTADPYLLGLLNSLVARFYFVQTCAALEGPGEAYLRFFGQYLEGFPVPSIEVVKKSSRDLMVQLVEQMLSLHQQLAAAKTPQDLTVLQRQIDATDRQIDQLVYELYDLTAEEIRIVEANP